MFVNSLLNKWDPTLPPALPTISISFSFLFHAHLSYRRARASRSRHENWKVFWFARSGVERMPIITSLKQVKKTNIENEKKRVKEKNMFIAIRDEESGRTRLLFQLYFMRQLLSRLTTKFSDPARDSSLTEPSRGLAAAYWWHYDWNWTKISPRAAFRLKRIACEVGRRRKRSKPNLTKHFVTMDSFAWMFIDAAGHYRYAKRLLNECKMCDDRLRGCRRYNPELLILLIEKLIGN